MLIVDKRHKRCGFSLSEVLITLTVIGVLAAMTIPSLVQSYQNKEYVTKLKKVYTTTNQALQQMAADMGCTGDLRCTGLFSITSDNTIIGDELVKYFSVAKNCKTALNQACWAVETNGNYDGTSATKTNYDAQSAYKFLTNDGTSFFIKNYNNDCITDGSGTSLNYSTGRTGNMKQTCASIYIDVNGAQKPNFWGKDTFAFQITNGKGPLLYPRGGSDDNYTSTDNWWLNPADGKTPRLCVETNKIGTYCTGRVVEEGWEMNY